MCQMENSIGGSCVVCIQRCLLGYLGAHMIGWSFCYKLPFREGRGIMKCLGMLEVLGTDGLNQCLLLTFSPVMIVRLNGFVFGLVAWTLYQHQNKCRQRHVQYVEFDH